MPLQVESASDDGAGRQSLLRSQLPFLAILALAIVGVAYTNISQRPLVGYWEFLAILTGARMRAHRLGRK